MPAFVLQAHREGRDRGSFEAAVLFVDISGFTALTERLQGQGVEGAEVLGRILAACFGPIAELVVAHGGILPLYAGDALLAIFPGGTEAIARAVAVADGVGAQFGAGGLRLQTRLGEVVVHARIGLGTGPVSWGIPTDGTRSTWYFRGPGIDAAVAAEAGATPGSPAGIEEHRGLPAPEPLPPPPEPDRDALLAFVDEAVLDPGLGAEFRPVWPIFLAFEPVEDPDALHAWVGRVIALCRQLGVGFSQLDFGDKGGNLVLLVGAPRARERGGERAIRLLQRLREEGGPRWRAGLCHGVLWAGFRGGPARREYGVMGRAINRAARLCMQAPLGQTWADRGAVDLLEPQHSRIPLGPKPIRGGQTVEAWAVEAGDEEASLTRSLGFVGRALELDQLAAVLAALTEARTALVVGDGGIGKTQLVGALEARWIGGGGRPFLRVTGDALRQTALHPFLALVGFLTGQERHQPLAERERALHERLDGLITSLAPRDPELASELDRLRSVIAWAVGIHREDSPAGRMEPRLRAENIRRAVASLVAAWATLGPSVLVVEDCQWLDPDSLALLERIRQSCAALPLCVLGTARPPEPSEHPALAALRSTADPAIRLEALDRGAVADLVRICLGAPPDPALLDRLVAETAGNPLFVESLALDLEEQGVLVIDDERASLRPGADVRVPSGLAELLIARIDRLAGDVRQVVQTAAVLGQEFDVRVLSRMLLLDPGDPRVQAAEAERIWAVVARLRYAFRHALLHAAAYDMQLRASLRSLHELAATGLEQEYADDLALHHAEIARHLARAELPSRELPHRVRAAEVAREAHAVADARADYERILALAPAGDPVRLDALFWRVRLDLHLSEHDAAREHIEAFRSEVDPETQPGWLAKVEWGVSELAHLESRFEDMIAAARLSEAAARRAGDRRWAVEGLYKRAVGLIRSGHLDEAKALLEPTVEEARAIGDTGAVRYCLSSLGLIEMERSQHAQAAERHREILRLEGEGARTVNSGTALLNLGLCLMEQGLLDEARARMAESLACFEELVLPHAANVAVNNLAGIAALSGDYAFAREYGQRALAHNRRVGSRRGEGFCLITLAEAALRSGEPREAHELAREAMEVFVAIGSAHGRMSAGLQLARIAQALGRLPQALNEMAACEPVARELGNLQNQRQLQLDQARLHLALGDPERARSGALALLVDPGGADMVASAHAVCAWAALALGELDRAHEHARQAEEATPEGACAVADAAAAALEVAWRAGGEVGPLLDRAVEALARIEELTDGLRAAAGAAEVEAKLGLGTRAAEQLARLRARLLANLQHEEDRAELRASVLFR